MSPTDSPIPTQLLLWLLLGAVTTVGAGLYRRALAWPIGMLSVLGATASSWVLLGQVMRHGELRHRLAGWPAPVGIELRVDLLSAFVATVILTIATLVWLYAQTAVRRESPDQETAFYGMALVLLLGLCGIVLTGDLFNLYVFFEVSSLAGYALMAVGSRKAVVSAFRYLLLGTLGASFYLMGIGYLYVLTGTLNMADMSAILPQLHNNSAVLLSCALIATGVGLKMALFPMHSWLPDAYTYASSTTTALIAPIMTKVSAYVMIRLLFFVYGLDFTLEHTAVTRALCTLAAAGVVVGSTMAIAQTNVKRMLAYSSIAQVAYIGIGIGLATPMALLAAMLHIMNHAVMKSCLFLITGGIALSTGRTQVQEFSGLGRKMPWTFAAFTCAALAMVGVPPTAGFFSKWYLIVGGLEAGAWGMVALIIASSLLTAVYFFRILERIYTEPAPADTVAAPGLGTQVPALALAIALIVLGLGNSWVVQHVLIPALPLALQGQGGA